MLWIIVVGLVVLALIVLALFDVFQKEHAIRRNFPLIGRLRYLLERIGPELRQYIVTDNDSERPFSRDQRRWVYASAKMENPYFGFGTDNNLEDPSVGYVIIKQAAFPHPATPADHDDLHPIASPIVLGERHGRARALRPSSIVNVSAMSYGSLSAAAVEALNRGSAIAGNLHNTGEGGIADCHRHGGDLIFQLGTGYFGVRDSEGRFDLDRLVGLVESDPVKMIEIKLSQGAKPGLGGMLPGAKVTPEIARVRGIPVGKDCASPASHTAFNNVDSMIEFCETLGDATGLPIGIKAAVGQLDFWTELAQRMVVTGGGPDFITIDGGEGGTGAAPLSFSDHVALPFFIGFPRVYRQFAEAGIHQEVGFVGGGKLGFPESGLLALALGCDLLNVGREPMLAIGCVQAQKCHSGHCPTGVATQSGWLARGLDPTDKGARLANYMISLRKELLRLAHACGEADPSTVSLDRFELLEERFRAVSAQQSLDYQDGWGLPGR